MELGEPACQETLLQLPQQVAASSHSRNHSHQDNHDDYDDDFNDGVYYDYDNNDDGYDDDVMELNKTIVVCGSFQLKLS